MYFRSIDSFPASTACFPSAQHETVDYNQINLSVTSSNKYFSMDPRKWLCEESKFVWLCVNAWNSYICFVAAFLYNRKQLERICKI
jgi:hypothetical protein